MEFVHEDIGLSWVEYRLADQIVDNLAVARKLGFDSSFIETKVGFRRLRHLRSDEDPLEFVARAVRDALQKHDISPATLDCLIYVTQTPLNRGIPHGSAILHQALDMRQGAACFDVGLGCSGFVYALGCIQSFMAVNGYSSGLIVTFDPYSRIVDRDDRDVAAIFSDGAAVAYVSRQNPTWKFLGYDFGTSGIESDSLARDARGFLRMNGRRVYNFCATNVPRSIKAVAGSRLSSVDRFVLHQGSKFIVDTIAQRIGAGDRAPFVAADYGNVVSSSVPATFVDAVRAEDQSVIMCGFGVGLSWGTALLQRVR